jgi:hypothetical protein
MLDTLRTYGARLLVEADEQDTVTSALAAYALQMAEEAAAGLQAGAGEAAAARWLDAEDPATRQVLAGAICHDAAAAVRLTGALCWWWQLRGRLPAHYAVLSEIAGLAKAGNDSWCAIQGWLGWAEFWAADRAAALGHFTVARDAAKDRVGRQKSATCGDLLFYAARWYSWMRPPRTGRRSMCGRDRSATGRSGRGGRSCRLRCGRRRLSWISSSASTRRRCRSPKMSIWSVTSLRAVSTNRSAKAFARGDRGGIVTARIPEPARTASKEAVN